MALHPLIQSALAAVEGTQPYSALPIAEARVQAKKAYPAKPAPVPVGAVRDLTMAGPAGPMALRVYAPPAAAGQRPAPMLVFFHGSGFVMLDLDTHDDICRRLCAGTSCVVVSVDYRLAPEHRFPAAPDDCLAAARWVAANAPALGGDAKRMALAGDSAGGCLAAVTALRVRDEGGPPLRGLLMFDEGLAFAERLRGAGIPTVARRYAGMNHGFLKYAGVIEADAAMADACDWLTSVL